METIVPPVTTPGLTPGTDNSGVGGSLDVFAGVVERAPKFWSDHGLEWFYRLCKEPKRIGRMMKLPLFLVHVRKEKRGK